jgi:hypothetical protein
MRIPLRGTYDDGERLRTWRSWTEATGPLVDRNTMSALTSWKEISDYVGKGVRTVQRWESEFGFPIRRTKPGRKSVVLAIPSEIDAWLQAQQFPDGQLDSVESERTALFQTVRELRSEIRELRSENRQLQRQLSHASKHLPILSCRFLEV